MPTYNDASLEYDEAEWTYDGVELRSDVTLVIGSRDATDDIDDAVSVKTGAHGNSRGTLDVTLDAPALVPVTEDPVGFYIATDRLFGGRVKTVDVSDDRVDRSLGVDISAQDDGPNLTGVPTSAPFAVVDTAPGAGEVEYASLRRQTRTTEGGAPKTTYELVLDVAGLLPGMNVEVTSSAFGLSATELEVSELQLELRLADDPHFVYVLGEPQVHLAQVVEEIAAVGPGEITETEIADDAISTPKLQALAVISEKIQAGAIATEHLAAGAVETDKLAADAIIANVANVGGTVVIDATGMTVIDGGIEVRNPSGTVIIDGSSNMFKIAATGTLATTSFSNPANPGDENTVDVATGLTFAPAAHIWRESNPGATPESRPVQGVVFDNAGVALDWFSGWVGLVSTNQTRVTVQVASSRGSGTTAARTFRYYIMQETAF